jgi:hypothetical protein
MAVRQRLPERLAEIPTQEVVEKALSRLCTKALRTYWILEPEGRILLGLDCVREHLKANFSEEKDYAVALRKYLEDPVQRVESPQYRTILEVVLGLGDDEWKTKEWRHEKAKARRTRAGVLFRGSDEDDETVEADTIRQHHEPRAIHALAEIVWTDEMEARSKLPKDTAGD